MRLRSLVAVCLCFSIRICSAADDLLIADFEGDDYGHWKVSGDALGQGPARGTLPNQMPVSGFEGRGLVNSFAGGDNSQGTLTSPEMKLERRYINFLIGGGRHPNEACINLLVDGKTVRSATGSNSEHLRLRSWDVGDFNGKTARIEIVDRRAGNWGHINVDQIVQSDQQPIVADERTELLAAAEASVRTASERASSDKSRPTYHVLPPANWLNDPNGPLYHNGYYHLFFQHNPYGDEWGNMHWAHVRSRDLAVWERMPIALWPSRNDGEEHVFSGSAAVDGNGQLMLFYTSIGGRLPEQWAAIPEDDDLVRWKKHPENPILTEALHDKKIHEWRDPYHFKVGEEHYLVLGGNLNNSAGGQAVVTVYRAENKELTKWRYLGILFDHPDAKIKNIECPLFFPLGNRWVLIISQGQPVQYFVGDLDRQTMKFTPTTRGVMDWGNYYAPNCFTDPKDKTILWGWMNGTAPGRGWRHCMTLPRELSLGDDGTLRQRPAESLAKLRGEPLFQIGGEIDTAGRSHNAIRGDALELLLVIEPQGAKGISITLPRTGGAPAINLSLKDKYLELQGTRADVELAKDRPTELRMFVDHSVVELYVDDRACITRYVDAPREGAAVESLHIRPEGGSVTVKNLTAWPIRSGWTDAAAQTK